MLRKLGRVFQRVRGGAVELSTRPYQRMLTKIDSLEAEYRSHTDDRLRTAIAESRQEIQTGRSPDQHLLKVFAIVREVVQRVLGWSVYDEQIMAGVVMHQGKVVQMQTGEGKTLAAVAPALLNALAGRGAHVLTFNDYLARRDFDWMGPIYEFLGLSVGCVAQGMSISERKVAYQSDVTYVTAKEAGFDFLRDQITRKKSELVQRGHHYAIVDEADSILVDEARVPLVIAGESPEPPVDVRVLADIVREMQQGKHYQIGARARNVHFTSAGFDHLEDQLDCGDLHDEEMLPLLTRANQALHAEYLMSRDIDYLVRDGEVLLLDELTGRVAENRRWPYGLQAAVEAKEEQPIKNQGQILQSVTLQHFVDLYDKLSGMTGTAESAAEELASFYGTRVVVLPTHEPCIRDDDSDQIYGSKKAKYDAVADCIRERQAAGQPVLVGTASVQESDELAQMLRSIDIPCQILNAKNDHQEAAVIGEAGTFRSVTISTNMAGRGTDIKLGGVDEQDRMRIVGLGGLFVIGTNRHESRRIDNQLRGRAGRQGDPGQSRFIVSLEDDLLCRFGLEETLEELRVNKEADALIDDPRVSAKVAHIQRVIEGECFEIRRTLRKYSEIIENQRRTISAWRSSLLLDESPQWILPTRAADRYDELATDFGEATLQDVERQIAIDEIDRQWADHLERLSEIRESIHLFSLGGLDPYMEFLKKASQAFRELQELVEDGIVERFNNVAVTSAGIDLQREGMVGPSATWTYMITDHPVGDVLDRLSRSVKQMFGGE